MKVIDLICSQVDGAFLAIDGLAERFPNAPAAKGISTSTLKTFTVDRKGHDRRYAINGAKARRELGYVPKYGFERGLRNTLLWYLANEDWWKALGYGHPSHGYSNVS